MVNRVAFAVLVLCVAAVAATSGKDEDDIATKYKCGSECDEKLMDSSDPNADSMPHTFRPEVPVAQPALLPHSMNAYLPSDIPDNVKMAPLNHGVYGMPGNSQGQHGLHSLPTEAQIPYEPSKDVPALRRPCNLEEVAELLRSIKQEYQAEDTHDTHLHAATLDGGATLLDAQRELDDANKRVQELLEAKQANETLTNVLVAIGLRADLLQSVMEEKAMLISEEGTLKAPILKKIGHANILVQDAVNTKQNALNEISQHPAFKPEEIQQLTATHDELIVLAKKQVETLQLEAQKVLTPIQIKINHTEHDIQRLEAEIIELKKEQEQLIPAAEKYSPVGLETAQAIAAAAQAHLAAEKEVQRLELAGYDQRSKDRSEITHVVDQMLMLVSDIQQPQDPKDKFVESKRPQSLQGSFPRVPFAPLPPTQRE